jgi:hypothetical protein
MHFLLVYSYCLPQQVIEGKIKEQLEVTIRRGIRSKKLLDNLKDRRGYCQLMEEALDRTMWRNRFGRGFGPVVWQITDDDGDDSYSLIYLHITDPSETLIFWFLLQTSGLTQSKIMIYCFHSFTVHLNIIASLFIQLNAQLECSRKMLKFTFLCI